MKNIIIGVLILSLLFGCKKIGTEAGMKGEIDTELTITDTTGVVATLFKTGDNFDMYFTIINQTNYDYQYSYSGIRVVFEIRQGDSLISSSIDGLAWPASVEKGNFKKGVKYTFKWRAPNSPLNSQLGTDTILNPGQYVAKAGWNLPDLEHEDIPSKIETIRIID